LKNPQFLTSGAKRKPCIVASLPEPGLPMSPGGEKAAVCHRQALPRAERIFFRSRLLQLESNNDHDLGQRSSLACETDHSGIIDVMPQR
jgi:hypothetical protein